MCLKSGVRPDLGLCLPVGRLDVKRPRTQNFESNRLTLQHQVSLHYLFLIRICYFYVIFHRYQRVSLSNFYVYGSVHRWSILIIVLRHVTQIHLFIILQAHSTCFGCQPHPLSGVHKTVTTASGTVQLPPSDVANLAWPRQREVAAQTYDQYRRL